jgi:hypothetical protein
MNRQKVIRNEQVQMAFFYSFFFYIYLAMFKLSSRVSCFKRGIALTEEMLQEK